MSAAFVCKVDEKTVIPEDGPLFFLASDGKTICKRPVVISRDEDEKRTVTLVGFPICTVSEFVDPALLVAILNETVT